MQEETAMKKATTTAQAASEYTVKQLPSGFWSVWHDGTWLEASMPTREAAEQFILTITDHS